MFDFVSRACDYLGGVWRRPHLLGMQNLPPFQSVENLQALSLDEKSQYLQLRADAIDASYKNCVVRINRWERVAASIMGMAIIYSLGDHALGLLWKNSLKDFLSCLNITVIGCSFLTYQTCFLAREKIDEERAEEFDRCWAIRESVVADRRIAVSNPRNSVAPSV